MPPIERHDLRQTAVLWEWNSEDVHGEPLVELPIEVKVRWVWQTRQVQAANGNNITTSATVIVNRDIPINSLMWLGTKQAYDETTEDTVMQVVSQGSTTDLKARHTRYEYGLAFFRGVISEIGTG